MATITGDFLEEENFQKQLQDIIRNGDPNTLTAKTIRKQLEEHFSLDQDSLKPFKDTVNQKINEVYSQLEEEEADGQETPLPKASTNGKKRKIISSEEEVDDTDQDSEEPKKKSKTIKKKKSTSEEENTDEDMEEEEEEEEEEEDKDEYDDDSSSPSSAPKKKKRVTKKSEPAHIRTPGTDKEEDTIKKLKQFISKCGVRKVWSRELSDCNSAQAEINKLRGILNDLGVTGRITIEKCEAIKKERELKAEVDGLDRSLILDEETNGRPSRLRNRTQNRPSYKLEESSDESEEEEEEGDDENNEEKSKKRSKKSSNSDDDEAVVEEDEGDDDDDESSGDEFHDSSDEE